MPFTNTSSEQSVYNADPTPIKAGCAVIPSGGLTTRAANVKHPSGADAWFIGVASTDIATSDYGIVYQQPMSNVQVRLASNVSRNDKLNVANAEGEFQTAPGGALNAKYIALSNGVAGSNTTWAAPI